MLDACVLKDCAAPLALNRFEFVNLRLITARADAIYKRVTIPALPRYIGPSLALRRSVLLRILA